MENKMVSIILPAYNAERYITECIESVIKQLFQNWELILVDDGSEDGTRSIAEKYAKQDDRIKYHRLNNGGVSKARNYGLKVAKGDFVFFLDADDYLANNCLDDSVKICIEKNTDIVVLAHYEQDENIHSCKKNNKFEKTQILDDTQVITTFLMTDMIGWEVWGKLFRRDAISNVEFDETLRIGEDAVFLLNVLLKCNKVVLLKEYGYYYRINMNSVMAQSFNEKNLDTITAISKMYKLVEKKYFYEANSFKLKYYIWFLRNYHCKIKKQEKEKYNYFIKNIRNDMNKYTNKNAFQMLSKKYFTEYILIKYVYDGYTAIISLLHKCNIV